MAAERSHKMWISAFTVGAPLPTLHNVLYLAEFYLPADTSLADLAARVRAGAQETARAGVDIHFVQAIFVPRDESCFALYQAGSAHAVVTAGIQSGLAYDSVAEAFTTP